MKLDDYALRIEPLPHGDGGGFLVTVPDQLSKSTLPASKTYSGQFVQRIPAACVRSASLRHRY